MADGSPSISSRIRFPDALGALRYRDFRLFWIGAMVSFVGSWIQTTGQQWLVYDLTGSTEALGLLTFIGAAPLFFLSPLGGLLADRYNKRTVLVICSMVFALSAFGLSAAIYTNQVSFMLIATLAFVNGCTSVIEIPTRQATISHIVAAEELGNAVPLNASTFNLARVIGPAIGGILLQHFGPGACYMANGMSYAAIILAIIAIRADLRSSADRSASLKETLLEGIVHVMRSPAFRLLVVMMIVTALFGVFYISMMAAFAESVLRVGPSGYAALLTSTGIGAILGIVILTGTSHLPIKGWIPIVAMIGFGASLIALSLVRHQWPAMVALGLVGAFGICQMVGTNTALQFFSPPALRGRIVAVHMWSLAGVSPLGALMFGWISHRIGLPGAYLLGGSVVLGVGLLVLCLGGPLKRLR